MDLRHVPSPQGSFTPSCGVQEAPLCLVTVGRQSQQGSSRTAQVVSPARGCQTHRQQTGTEGGMDSLPVDLTFKTTSLRNHSDAREDASPGVSASPERPVHVFRCGACPETFGDPSNLVQHLRSRHVPQERSLQCQSCLQNFWFLSWAEDGSSASHASSEPRQCQACSVGGKSFPLSAGSDWTHATTQSSTDRNSATGVSNCPVKRQSVRDCSVHSEHSAEPARKKICAVLLSKNLTCQLCSCAFKDPSQLDSHMRLHRDQLSPQSHGNSAAREPTAPDPALESRVATNLSRILCSVCEMEFKSVAHLKRHMLTHSESRPHGCDECAGRFKHASHLALHKKSHRRQGKVTRRCHQCLTVFPSPLALSAHLQNGVCTPHYPTAPSPFSLSL